MNTELATLVEKLRGKFVVFDGPDGAGKSTQRQRLTDTLIAAGVEVVSCHDPGGTQIGDRVRDVLLKHDLTTMDVNCETMLFMASRAQLVAEVIRPALASNKTVLCDRFITSTCAYQGAAGYDPQRVIRLARFALNDFWPDVTIVLDIDPSKGFERTGRNPHHAGKNRRRFFKRFPGHPTLFEDQAANSKDKHVDSEPDAMEARSIDFHRRVQELFLHVHEYFPRPVITVDGRSDIETVHQNVLTELRRVIC